MSYLGNSPEKDIVINKKEYIATEGQTSFGVIYDDYVEVYLNGVRLADSDYTALTGANIVLSIPATAGDIIQCSGFQSVTFMDAVQVDGANGAAQIPYGTTAQRPTSPDNGYLRYNTDLLMMESYSNGEWGGVGGGSVSTTEVDATVVKQNGNVVANDSEVVHKTGDETIAGVKTFTDELKLQGQNVSPFSGFKNYIINGDMKIWQRGTTQTITTTWAYGSVDRWVFVQEGSANSIAQLAGGFHSGWVNGVKFGRPSGSTTTGDIHMGQVLEQINMADLQGQVVTLSFWVYKGTTFSGGTFVAQVGTGTGGQQVSTSIGGLEGQTTPIHEVVTPSGTLTQYQCTGTIPLTATNLYVQFYYTPTGTAGADDNLYITGVQLEKGSVATSFETRPYGLELALCQRYFYNFNNIDSLYRITSAVGLTTIPFPVSMRTAPTIITYRLEKDDTPQTVNSGATIVQVNKEGVLFVVDPKNYGFVDVMYFSASAEL